MYQPQPGDRVRVTRYVGGRVKFVKTGTIVDASGSHGYRFKDDDGRSVYLATCEQIAEMSGWSQTIEPLGS